MQCRSQTGCRTEFELLFLISNRNPTRVRLSCSSGIGRCFEPSLHCLHCRNFAPLVRGLHPRFVRNHHAIRNGVSLLQCEQDDVDAQSCGVVSDVSFALQRRTIFQRAADVVGRKQDGNAIIQLETFQER